MEAKPPFSTHAKKTALILQRQTPFHLDNAKQALWAFRGDVYQGMDADIAYFIGFIWFITPPRPLDLMQAYRLEMGTRFSNARGKDLYAFWGDIITEQLNTALEAQGDNQTQC